MIPGKIFRKIKRGANYNIKIVQYEAAINKSNHFECENCGFEIGRNTVKCPNCSQRIESDRRIVDEKFYRNYNKKGMFLSIILTLFIVLLGFSFLFVTAILLNH